MLCLLNHYKSSFSTSYFGSEVRLEKALLVAMQKCFWNKLVKVLRRRRSQKETRK
jgi:hypothetical protein